MTARELNKVKVPVIKIDHRLDKFEKMDLFVNKLKRANDVLDEVGLPGEGKRTVVKKKVKKYKIAESKIELVIEPATLYKTKKSRRKAPRKGK